MPQEPALSGGPLSHAIFRLAREHKSLAARLLRGCGLYPGQELVLMTLWNDGPQRQVDLVQTLDSDAPTMARSIARLERSGLVVREPSPTDRRALIVRASEASLALRGQVEGVWEALERATVGGMSGERTAEVLRVLAELEANLAAHAGSTASGDAGDDR